MVVKKLCQLNSLEIPPEIENLKIPEPVTVTESADPVESEPESEEEEFMAEDDMEMEAIAKEFADNNNDKEDEGADLSSELQDSLKRCSKKRLEGELKVRLGEV